MILSLKHQTFVDHFVQSRDAAKAYMNAYPNSKEATARVRAYDLLQKDSIKEFIENYDQEIRDTVKQNTIKEKTIKILTTIEKLNILAKIARGKTKFKDVAIIQGRQVEVIRLPTTKERIMAIEQENKMTGGFASTKTENRNVDKDGNDLIPTIGTFLSKEDILKKLSES